MVLLVEEYLNLHYKGPDGVSLYDRNKGIARQKRKKGKEVVEEPEDVEPPWWLQYLWDAFWSLNSSRRKGPTGIPEESIRAYQLNEGIKFSHLELGFIRKADARALGFWAERRREERQRAQDKAKAQQSRRPRRK